MIVNQTKISKISKISQPTSFYYLYPSPSFPSLPLIMMFGDIHGNKKGKCGRSYQCNKTCVKRDCCFTLSNPDFLKVLENQTDLYHPIDIYTEHWYHHPSSRSSYITYDGSGLDAIEKTLKNYTEKNDREKVIIVGGKEIYLKRIRAGKDKDTEKICYMCRKKIKDKYYYSSSSSSSSSSFHIKCTTNVRWQSGDVRQSFGERSIENEISNIFWEIDDPYYFLKDHHIYFMMCLLKENGKHVISEKFSRDKKYIFPDIDSNKTYEIDYDHFIKMFFLSLEELIEIGIPSIILKQIGKQTQKLRNVMMWRRIFQRSSLYYKRVISQEKSYIFFKTIEQKSKGIRIEYSEKINPILTIISSFLDVYTLLRMFKKRTPDEKKIPVLNILYFGLYHIKNINTLLTQPDTTHPEYSINFYKKVKHIDNEYRKKFRCIDIPEIDLGRDIAGFARRYQSPPKCPVKHKQNHYHKNYQHYN